MGLLAELDSPPPAILPRSHGFPLRAVGAELLSAEGVVVAEPDLGLQMLRSGGDIYAESNILFPELYAIVRPMPMVPMELTILGVISFGRV